MTYAAFYFLKHIYYPPITRSLRAVKNISRFEALAITVFLLRNIFCITFKPKMSTFITRTDVIILVNLIPLALGSRLNLVASSCGVGTEPHKRFHRWLGWIATAEGIIHSVAASIHEKPTLDRSSIRAAVVIRLFFYTLKPANTS